MQLKQNLFFKEKSIRTLILATSVTAAYKIILKSILIEQCHSMFTFYIENHEPFGPLTKNCSKLDKNKSIVSRFLVFIVYKSAVSTVQKLTYVGWFQFSSVNVCICTLIS